jgi:hypothetical protein
MDSQQFPKLPVYYLKREINWSQAAQLIAACYEVTEELFFVPSWMQVTLITVNL